MKAETGSEFAAEQEPRPLRSAVIIVDSRFGKTRKIADAIARGIRETGVPTEVLSVAEAIQCPLDTYDLIALGCPAHYLTSSSPVNRLLHGLKRVKGLRGHYGFAFETRLRHHPGGASAHIHSRLQSMGLVCRRKPATAYIATRRLRTPSSGGAPAEVTEFRLEPGAEDAFEALGTDVVKSIRGEAKEEF